MVDAPNRVPQHQKFYQAAYKNHTRLWRIVRCGEPLECSGRRENSRLTYMTQGNRSSYMFLPYQVLLWGTFGGKFQRDAPREPQYSHPTSLHVHDGPQGHGPQHLVRQGLNGTEEQVRHVLGRRGVKSQASLYDCVDRVARVDYHSREFQL